MSTPDMPPPELPAPATATSEATQTPAHSVQGDLATLVATVAQLAESVRVLAQVPASSSGRGNANYADAEAASVPGRQLHPELPALQQPRPELPVQEVHPDVQWNWSGTWSSGQWPPDGESWGGSWTRPAKPAGPWKADYSDPPSWPGWAHFRQWRKAVARWNDSTDVVMTRRADKVMKLFDWELQSKFEHLTDAVLQSPEGVSRIFEVMDRLSGVREGDDMRRVTRAALFEYSRRRDETLSMFVGRREQQYAQAEDFRVVLPSQVKALLLEEGAGLSAQGEQNLRTLTSARLDFEIVAKALRDLDTHRERLTAPPGKASSSFPEIGADASSSTLAVLDVTKNDGDDDDDDEISSDFENDVLKEVDAMALDENEIFQTYAAVLGQRRKTWSENKALKRAIATDRQFGTRRELVDGAAPSGASAARKGSGKGRGPRIPVDKLKAITKCRNFGEKGHWERECTKPKKVLPPPSGMVGFVSPLTGLVDFVSPAPVEPSNAPDPWADAVNPWDAWEDSNLEAVQPAASSVIPPLERIGPFGPNHPALQGGHARGAGPRERFRRHGDRPLRPDVPHAARRLRAGRHGRRSGDPRSPGAGRLGGAPEPRGPARHSRAPPSPTRSRDRRRRKGLRGSATSGRSEWIRG